MRYLLFISVLLLTGAIYADTAHAHFGLAGDDEVGHGLIIGYGLLLFGLVSFVVYRKWLRTSESPEQRTLKRNLRELQRARTSCLTQLQNAVDYPKECGLTESERLEREKSVALFEHEINEAEAHLAAA